MQAALSAKRVLHEAARARMAVPVSFQVREQRMPRRRQVNWVCPTYAARPCHPGRASLFWIRQRKSLPRCSREGVSLSY